MSGLTVPPVITSNTWLARTLFQLPGANLNSALTDQAFAPVFSFTRYRITEIWVTNATASLAAMAGTLAVRTATGGGGTAIVAAQNLTALLVPANMIICTISNSDIRSDIPLYARFSAALGSAATADIYINGMALA